MKSNSLTGSGIKKKRKTHIKHANEIPRKEEAATVKKLKACPVASERTGNIGTHERTDHTRHTSPPFCEEALKSF